MPLAMAATAAQAGKIDPSQTAITLPDAMRWIPWTAREQRTARAPGRARSRARGLRGRRPARRRRLRGARDREPRHGARHRSGSPLRGGAPASIRRVPCPESRASAGPGGPPGARRAIAAVEGEDVPPATRRRWSFDAAIDRAAEDAAVRYAPYAGDLG